MVTYKDDALAIQEHLKSNRDAVVAVSGHEGEGKSSFAYQFCEAVDPTFDLKRICYTNKQFKKLIFSLPRYSAILPDEAVLTAHKWNWGDPEQREVMQLLTVSRDRLLFICFVIPELWDLNPNLRRHRVRANYFIPERGVALCYVKPPSLQGAIDPWFLERWQEIHRKWKPEMPQKKLYNMLRHIPNYSHTVQFPALESRKYDAYMKWKHENIVAMQDSDEEKKTDSKADLRRMAMLGKAVKEMIAIGRFRSINDACKWFKVDHKTVDNWVAAHEKLLAQAAPAADGKGAPPPPEVATEPAT